MIVEQAIHQIPQYREIALDLFSGSNRLVLGTLAKRIVANQPSNRHEQIGSGHSPHFVRRERTIREFVKFRWQFDTQTISRHGFEGCLKEMILLTDICNG